MGLLDDLGERDAAERVADDRGGGRRRWLVLTMALFLLAAAYLALHRYAEHRVPFGTQVEGVGIGGLAVPDAEQRLAEELAPRLRGPVTFTHDDRSYRFDPAAAGMRLDAVRSVREAGGDAARWTPAALWRFLTGGRDRAAAVAVDVPRFTGALDALTARIGQPLIEGDVRFVDGHARAVFGQPGLTVDHDRTEALVARLAFEGHPGELPLITRRPYVAPAAVRAALRDIARPAMSAPVVLDLGGHRVSVPPQILGQALDTVPAQGRLALLVDADHLADLVVAHARTLGPKPVNATVRLRNGRPVVVAAVDGVTFDHQQLGDRLPAVLRRPPGQRVLRIHAVVQTPGRTNAEVRSWKIHRRLAWITVGDGRRAGLLDAVVLPPGGSLHLSARLGGEDEQLATALFTLALRAGLPVTSSTVPATYDQALPAGLQRTDVTIAAPPDSGVLVTLTGARPGPQLTVWGAQRLHVRVAAGRRHGVVAPPVQTSAAPDCTPRDGSAGFTVTVRRRIGHRPPERFDSTYPPVPSVTCLPPPTSSSPTPSSPTPSSPAPPSPSSGAAR